MSFPRLVITDGTTTINLLGLIDDFDVDGWFQQLPQYKRGGIYQNSALADGERLVDAQWTNLIDEFPLTIKSSSNDRFAASLSALQQMLVNATDYWTNDYGNIVWLEKRASCESNTLYSTVNSGSILDLSEQLDGNFAADSASANRILRINHNEWKADPPFDIGECVELDGSQDYENSQATWSGRTLANTDEALSFYNGVSFTTGPGQFQMGYNAVDSLRSWLRFQNVNVPAGATIISAHIVFRARVNSGGPGTELVIFVEDSANPAAYSTFLDAFTRNYSYSYMTLWNGTGEKFETWTAGNSYNTPDLTSSVQHIVEKPGWAAGNAMAFQIRDWSCTPGSVADANSFAGAPASSPQLVIEYRVAADNYGRTTTCENEVYVANKQNKAQLTNAYHYDSSAVNWSANLIGAALPFNLLPNPVGNGDFLVFGVNTDLAESGPFASIVYDVGTVTAPTGNADLIYEYWNGAWVALSAQDNTAGSGNASLRLSGVNSVHWDQPSDWTIANLNTIFGGAAPNVNGYWVRLRASVPVPPGDSITTPTQQNRELYTVVRGSVTVAADELPGDIEALARMFVYNQSDNRTAPLSDPNLWADRVIVGTRSTSRGSNFSAFLNLDWTNGQNPPDVSIASGTNTVFSVDPTATTGGAFVYTPVGVEALANRVRATIYGETVREYQGRFRFMLRAKQTGGASGDITLRGVVNINQTGQEIFRSDTKIFSTTNDWQLIDFGTVNIASSLYDETEPFGIRFRCQCGSPSGAGPAVKFYDFILLPVDEWAGDFRAVSGIKSIGNQTDVQKTKLDIDSIYSPRESIRANTKYIDVTSGGSGLESLVRPFLCIASKPFQLKRNTEQKIWFVMTRNTSSSSPFNPQAEAYIANSIQAWRVSRYLGMIGSG